jgi:hypothetical protein
MIPFRSNLRLLKKTHANRHMTTQDFLALSSDQQATLYPEMQSQLDLKEVAKWTTSSVVIDLSVIRSRAW